MCIRRHRRRNPPLSQRTPLQTTGPRHQKSRNLPHRIHISNHLSNHLSNHRNNNQFNSKINQGQAINQTRELHQPPKAQQATKTRIRFHTNSNRKSNKKSNKNSQGSTERDLQQETAMIMIRAAIMAGTDSRESNQENSRKGRKKINKQRTETQAKKERKERKTRKQAKKRKVVRDRKEILQQYPQKSVKKSHLKLRKFCAQTKDQELGMDVNMIAYLCSRWSLLTPPRRILLRIMLSICFHNVEYPYETGN